jgi:hypothetical protein
MATSESSDARTGRIGELVSNLLDIEAQVPFDRDRWRSLKEQLAATPAADLADVAAKLSVVHREIEFDADRLDSNILQSAITELQRVSNSNDEP